MAARSEPSGLHAQNRRVRQAGRQPAGPACGRSSPGAASDEEKPIGRLQKAVRATRVFESLSKSSDDPVLLPRWIGGQPASIDAKLVKQCTTSSSGGKVTALNFNFKFLTRISGLLDHGQYLQSLDLSSNNIRCMENLKDVPRLQVLNLAGCEIRRIESLEFCVQLTSVYLQDNRISAIEGLGGLRTLECLNLDANRITLVGRGLASLIKLKELYLSHNLLSSLDGLSGLKSLETLGLSGNRLQSISSSQLNGLERLDELRLASNGLQSLRFLSKLANTVSKPLLPRLATLDLASNHLTETQLQEMPKCAQMTELDLSGNRIRHFPYVLVAKLPAIEICDISQNQLESVNDMEELRHASSLRELNLQGNPGNLQLGQSEEHEQSDDNALEQLLAALPALQLFNGDPVPKRMAGTGMAPGEEDLGGTFHLTKTANGGFGDVRHSTVDRQAPKPTNMPRLPKRRYADEAQVEKWQQRVMCEYASIDRQVEKTVQRSKSDIDDMDAFINNCRNVMDRERKRSMEPDVPRNPRFGRSVQNKGLEQLHSEHTEATAALRAHGTPLEELLSPTASSTGDETGSDARGRIAASRRAHHHRSLASKKKGICSQLGRHVNDASRSSPVQVHTTTRNAEVAVAEDVEENIARHAAPDMFLGAEKASEALEVDLEQLPDDSIDASRDMEEVEEQISKTEEADDNVWVREARTRLRSVRAVRQHMKVCRLGIDQPQSRVQGSLQSALPFPSLESPTTRLCRARVGV